MQRLAGKRALIYGVGTGLGFACAGAMLVGGASVFITGRRPFFRHCPTAMFTTVVMDGR